MKIAVNTRLLLKDKLEGIGWFTFESLKRITQQHREHEFIFIFDRPYSEDFIFGDNITPIVIGPQARHPILYYMWFNFSIPKILESHQVDLFLSPDGFLPLKTKVKTLAVFHDLNFEHYPEDIPLSERYYFKKYYPKYAKLASRIATVSNFSKQDIIKQYGIEEEKIDVVYNGANESFTPVKPAIRKLVIEKHTGGKPYFIFIGALNPRKNLVNLLKAFDLFKKQDRLSVQLLIVGEKMFKTNSIFETYENMEFKADVIFSGRLNGLELRKALASALGLAYVSYFEGFGIPIVEAFYTETPVITSNVTSMPEVAGDAALLVDPFSPEDIAKALSRIATDTKLRESLIKKG
ncbi:MAG: glycosyltransferase, partial [Bacteroidales bacterium]|nr:glycosyltransferase [Bacteroidales bacterium]